MRTLTLEGIYRNGLVEVQDTIEIKEPMRVLIVFLEEYNPKKKFGTKFSFSKSLELTKNCKGKLSDEIVNERRTEKW